MRRGRLLRGGLDRSRARVGRRGVIIIHLIRPRLPPSVAHHDDAGSGGDDDSGNDSDDDGGGDIEDNQDYNQVIKVPQIQSGYLPSFLSTATCCCLRNMNQLGIMSFGHHQHWSKVGFLPNSNLSHHN